MKKYLILLLVIFSSPAFAEDLYIAQTAAGGGTGADCANALAVTFFNTAGNWGAGTGKITAGDTVHLCGTITTSLTIQDSGSAGSVITLLFETGAKLSKAVWGTTTTSAIYSSGKSYITIDGGTNGVIENTDNGTGLGNSVDSNLIYAINPAHWEVKNLTLGPVYTRTEGAEANAYGVAAWFRNVITDVKFHDCVVHDGNKLVEFTFWGTPSSAVEVYNNTISDAAVCLTVGSGSADAAIDDIKIHNNSFDRQLKWSGAGAIHTDLTHTFTQHSNVTMTNLQIYKNVYSGLCGDNVTTQAYVEAGVGAITGAKIYNNKFSFSSGATGCGSGHIYMKNNTNTLVYNNTFASGDSATQTALSIGGGTGIQIINNLFKYTNLAISPFSSTTSIANSDYNYFPTAAKFNWGTYTQISLATWKSTSGFDSHSLDGDVTLDADYAPVAGQPTIDAGTTLAAVTDDFIGTPRPQGSAFDIGAYEYVTGGVVNGTCGSANGVPVTSAPTTGLCATGTPSAVSGSGPWTWTCTADTVADCSAPLLTGTTVRSNGTVAGSYH